MTPRREWAEVTALLTRMLQLAKDAAPKAPVKVTVAESHILGMFWRSVRLFHAAVLLLQADLPEEATIIGRSLFEQSLHLRELAANPEARNAFILGWADASIKEKKGLIKQAVALGLEKDPASVLGALDRQQQAIHASARRHRITRLKRFRLTRAVATRYGRQDDYWTYEWSHEAVHGSEAAWVFGRHRISHDTVAVFAATADPAVLLGTAAFVASSLADSASATCAVFRWTSPAELCAVASEIHEAAEAAAG